MDGWRMTPAQLIEKYGFKADDFETPLPHGRRMNNFEPKRQAIEARNSYMLSQVKKGKWKAHPKFKDYLATDDGRIVIVPRLRYAGSKRLWTPKSRYLTFHPKLKNKTYAYTVHRFILETFIGPRPSDNHDGCHLNGNSQDNRLENLKWATKKENAFHKKAHGTSNEGSKHPMAILHEKDLPVIVRLKERGLTMQEISEVFGCSQATVSLFLRGETWTHAR